MPRARDNAAPASSRVPQFQQKPGVGSVGPIAALVTQQQEQAASMQKLIATMQKAQIENQRAVQEAARAGGGAATQVANQVASGLDRINKEKSRQQDRAEDRAFAEDQQRLNAQLQRDAAKEAASMGAAIQGQREQIMQFRDSWIAKRDQKRMAIEAYGARTDEMLNAGWFSSDDGRKQLTERRHHVDMMKAMHADHFDDRHLSAAYSLHNKSIQALIEGDDVMDLSRLRVEPLMLPMAKVEGNGRRLAKPGEISGDMMFELKMHGGYPKKGVVFNDDENFGLPEGYAPKLLSADVVLDAMARDDYLRFATDKTLRQELDRKNAEIIVQSRDRLEPMYEMYTDYNKMFNPMAGAAVQRSIENFLAEDNPHKFNDMPRQLVFGAVGEIFGGGRKGEEIAIIAAEIFDGKREPKSDKELMIAMALESALFNIKTHMNTEFMNADSEGSFASTLVKQMEEVMGAEQAALALGVPSSAVGFVQATQVMQGRLAEASSFANRAHMGMEKLSIIEQFQDELGRYARLADIYTMRVLDEGEKNERRVKELMGEADALQSSSEAVEAIPPSELQGEFNRTSAKDLESTMTHMDALIKLGSELGPDTLNEISAFITAELEPLTTSNLPAYLDQTRVENERSGYVRAATERSGFNLARNGRARSAREKRNPRSGPPSVGESFDEGGVGALITEQLPALISAAHGGISEGLTQGFTRVMAGAAGSGPATATARGARAIFQGSQPIPFPGETARIKKNLDPAEIQQIINASNEGR